jgi:hypothetical protein
MFTTFGLFFMLVARKYHMDEAMRMGPGYFPTMVGGLTAFFGGIVFFQSLVLKGENIPAMSFWPLFFITLSLIVFSFLLTRIGLVVASALLVLISAFAGHEFKFREVVILIAVLVTCSVLVFVKSIGLPFPLWPAFLH